MKAAFLFAWTVLMTLPALAQNAPTPNNTLSCEGFSKRPNGDWVAARHIKPFDIGSSQGLTVSNIIIPRGRMIIQGVDVWELLNEKCG
jgi:hypothetical protein